jgi:hypothetical protein
LSSPAGAPSYATVPHPTSRVIRPSPFGLDPNSWRAHIRDPTLILMAWNGSHGSSQPAKYFARFLNFLKDNTFGTGFDSAQPTRLAISRNPGLPDRQLPRIHRAALSRSLRTPNCHSLSSRVPQHFDTKRVRHRVRFGERFHVQRLTLPPVGVALGTVRVGLIACVVEHLPRFSTRLPLPPRAKARRCLL